VVTKVGKILFFDPWFSNIKVEATWACIVHLVIHAHLCSSKFDGFLREKNFLFIFPVKFISKLKFLIMTEYLVLARHTDSSCKEMYDRLDIIHYIEETCPQHYHRPVIIVRAYQCTVKSFNLINFNTVVVKG
jgi:hypothetical protein